MSRLRIAVVAPRIGRVGGAEQILLQDLQALADLPGVELTIVTTAVESGVSLPANARLAHVPPPRVRGGLSTLEWFARADRALVRLDASSFDRIYAPGINGRRATHLLLHACFAQQRDLHRAVARQHPLDARSIARQLRFSLLARTEARVLLGPRPVTATVSRRAAEVFEHHYGLQAAVLPPVIDTRRFSPQRRAELRDRIRDQLSLASTDYFVVAVGNAWYSKGLDLLIGAARTLGRAVQIGLVTTERPDDLRRLCGPLPQNVRLLPMRADIEAWYAAADLVALPSRGETLGLPPLEAAAMGVPALVSAAAGCAAWFEPEAVVASPTADAWREALAAAVERDWRERSPLDSPIAATERAAAFRNWLLG